jgi:YD repeat-containing protein
MITNPKNKLKNKTMKTTLLFILLTSISFAQNNIETKYFKDLYYLNSELELTKATYGDGNIFNHELFLYPNSYFFKNQVANDLNPNSYLFEYISHIWPFERDSIAFNYYKVEYRNGKISSITNDNYRYNLKLSYDKRGFLQRCTNNDIIVNYLCDNKGRILKSRSIDKFDNDILQTITTYDKKGNIIKIEFNHTDVYDRQADIIEFKYDEKNNKVKIACFDKNNQPVNKGQNDYYQSKEWKYNAQNLCIESIINDWSLTKHFYQNGKLIIDSSFSLDTKEFAGWTKYIYNDEGKLVQKTNLSGYLYGYLYNNSGQLIEDNNYDLVGKLIYKNTYKYNNFGICIEKESRGKNNELFEYGNIELDEKNRLTSINTVGPMNNLKLEISSVEMRLDNNRRNYLPLDYDSLLLTGDSLDPFMVDYDTSNYLNIYSSGRSNINWDKYYFDINQKLIQHYHVSKFEPGTTNDFEYLNKYTTKQKYDTLNETIEIESKIYDEKNELQSTVKCTYHKGLLVERTIYYPKAEEKQLTGQIRWIEGLGHVDASSRKIILKYDNKDNFIEKNIFDNYNEDKIVSSEKRQYDKNNILTEISYFDENGKTTNFSGAVHRIVFSKFEENCVFCNIKHYYNIEGKEVFYNNDKMIFE